MMPWILVCLGLAILILAGDALVKGAVNLSLRAGLPALIVSLTIVAFGTSAPELLVSISASLKGSPGVALGNVVGSNIANILMVLGIPALITVLHMAECEARKSYIQMVAVSALFIALAFTGWFTFWSGLLLLAVMGWILYDMFKDARQHRKDAACAVAETAGEVEGADPDMAWWQIALFLGLGLAGLPLGADILVDNAAIIARSYGISDAAIGLTLIALGTSLPELATTVMAALRKQADVAMGNVIGSNIFNLLAIIGITALIKPLPVDAAFLHFDLWIMLAVALLLGPFVFLRLRLNRLWGIGFVALYIAYVTFILV